MARDPVAIVKTVDGEGKPGVDEVGNVALPCSTSVGASIAQNATSRQQWVHKDLPGFL